MKKKSIFLRIKNKIKIKTKIREILIKQGNTWCHKEEDFIKYIKNCQVNKGDCATCGLSETI